MTKEPISSVPDSSPFNSPENLRALAAAGRLTWTAPVLVLPARSIFLIFGQSLWALVFHWQGTASPWSSAGAWWTVWGSVADFGCLALLYVLTRREGLRVRDLVTPFPPRIALTAFAYFFLVIPISVLGTFLSSWTVYGSWQAPMPAGVLVTRHLPLWAMLYSLIVWPVIWSATEELTYNGYLATRFDSLSGRQWVSLGAVGFWWAAQHCFLPLVPDWRFVLWRFLAFVPGVLALAFVYLRTRKLAPLILVHWVLDFVAAATTLSF